MKKINFRHQDILFCSIVAVLLICISANATMALLSRSINLRFDMTDNKLYQLSDTTKEVLRNTRISTQITVCSSKADFWVVGVELLERYQALSDHLSVSYVDPYTQPMVVENYRSKGVNLEQSDILIEQGENYQVIALDQLYTADATGENIQNILAEQVITSAIFNIAAKEQKTVLFTAGHNETPTKALYSVFTENGFSVKDISISLNEIASDSVMLVIANPAQDFTKDETDRLTHYFESGGKILVFLGASEQEYPILTSFLEKYSISPAPYVVLDNTLYADRNYLNIIGAFAAHPVNEYFLTNQYYPVLPQSRPLEISQYSESDLSVKPLLYSSDTSYRKAFSSLSDIAKATDDPAGPFVLSAIAEKKFVGNTAMLIVTGSDFLYADDLMQSSTYANRAYIMQMLDYCTPEVAMLNIPPKQLSPDPVVVLERHLLIIGLIVVGVVAVLLIGGFVIISRRKNL